MHSYVHHLNIATVKGGANFNYVIHCLIAQPIKIHHHLLVDFVCYMNNLSLQSNYKLELSNKFSMIKGTILVED